MTQPPKYLIVSIDHNDYDALITAKRLTPGTCFQCATYDEALYTSHRNDQWGIETTVLQTPEWIAKHGYPRTGEVA